MDAWSKNEIKQFMEILTAELKCSVCLSVVKKPSSLPCNHFYCGVCLDRIFAQCEGRCPQCRKKFAPRQRVEDPTIPNLVALYRRLHELTSEDLQLDILSQGEDLIPLFRY